MQIANFKGKLMFLIFVCQLTLLIVILPLYAEDMIPVKEKGNEARQIKTSMDREAAGEVGVARYYAKRYNGKRTSSGVAYNPRKLTAAHSTFPLGTRVKVVNIANNRSVIVTINDRCRKYKTPFIDLSRMAASQLGFLGRAKANVRIIPLEKDKPLLAESSEPLNKK